VPDAAKPGVPFQVSVLDGEPGVPCQMYDTDTNRLVSITQAQPQDDKLVATFTAPQPGLYRITASGGGFNPVERLVPVMA
jgi:hypothetical protein